MRMQSKSIIIPAMLVLLAISGLPALAQHEGMVRADKKGVIHTNSTLRVGGALLKPGMYQVQHLLEGDNHVITFREIDMRYTYKEPAMMALPAGAEAARVQCNTEPANKKWRSTTLLLRTNAAGEREVAEVRIKGENVKHVF